MQYCFFLYHSNYHFTLFSYRAMYWDAPMQDILGGKYTYAQKSIYSILYTASFATLFFYIFFPLDIFLVNMLCVQLPLIRMTGTTLHGFLSGNMRTRI